MNRTWSIRGFKDVDKHKVNSLFNSIFHSKRTMDHWSWEFQGNPEGFSAIVAVDNENIIGHLAGLKRHMKIGGFQILSSLEVDGMTHPDYSRQGIFVDLGKRFLSDSKNEGVKLVFGFPNEKALPGHRKLHCVELTSLHIMIMPINIKNISKKMFSNRFSAFFANITARISFGLLYRPKKPKSDEHLNIKTLNELDNRFDDLWIEAQGDHDIILNRDSKYLKWRYLDDPGQRYKMLYAEKNKKVLGWVVLRTLKRFGLENGAIVDMFALPGHENVIHSLIHEAVKELKQRNVDLIASSIPKSSFYYEIFKKCGFMTCPKKLNPKEEPFIIYPLSEKLDMKMIKIPDKWHITWGDTDVV
jgi:hypothetical protein